MSEPPDTGAARASSDRRRSWNRRRWNLYARVYGVLEAPTRGARRRSLELLDPQPGERLLLVGCGTGLDLDFLSREVEIVAVDLAPLMVARTAARARRLDLPVVARVMDAGDLAFEDASFDALVLHLILAVTPDPAACMREAVRVTRPGGRAAVFDKFAAGRGRLSLARRVLNRVTRPLATDITRRLEDVVDWRHFSLVHEEPSLLAGQLRIALLRRLPDSGSDDR